LKITRRIFLYSMIPLLTFPAVAFVKPPGTRGSAGNRSAPRVPRAAKMGRAFRNRSQTYGGHFSKHHWGKSRRHLKNRFEKSAHQQAFGKANVGKSYNKLSKNKRMVRAKASVTGRRYSSFRNSTRVDAAIGMAVKNNSAKIKKFLKSKKRKQMIIHFRDKKPLGYAFNPKTGKLDARFGGAIIIRKNGNKYYPHTGWVY